MTFDRELLEAELALHLVPPERMPSVAWDALEAGLDGPMIRRVAAMTNPTGYEVDQVFQNFATELGVSTISPGEAAHRIATRRVREILNKGDDPLRWIGYFEGLWFRSGYAKEIALLGQLGDESFIANRPDEETRSWLREELARFLKDGSWLKRE